MITVRKAAERGHSRHDWLDSWYSFSFADYHDPRWMGVSALRVLNEDRIAPRSGFPMHPHRDMEILTYVLEGALEHRDSAGHHGVIRPGEVQRMSAGRGIMHSEMNPSPDTPVHLLQIWIVPDRQGLAPRYEQRAFPAAERRGRLRLLAGPDGGEQALTLHQDARLFATELPAGGRLRHPLAPGRIAYLHVARGTLAVNGQRLEAGDGAVLEAEAEAVLQGLGEAEALLFDLPGAPG